MADDMNWTPWTSTIRRLAQSAACLHVPLWIEVVLVLAFHNQAWSHKIAVRQPDFLAVGSHRHEVDV
jgi:hypothetical protein